MEQETKRTKRGSNSNGKPYRVYLLGVLALVVVAGVGYFGYNYWNKNYSSPEAKAKAEAAAQAEEKKDALASLGKLMVLPAGDPIMLKIDKEEVIRNQQAFFKDVKNDDLLFVFQESGKAVIFRPSSNLIVNAGPINFEQAANKTATSTTSTTPTTTTNTQKTK